MPLDTWVTVGHALTDNGLPNHHVTSMQTGPGIDSRELQVRVEPVP